MDDRKAKQRKAISRYYHIPGVAIKRAEKRLTRGDIQKWVIFSGSGEFQTSADAFFNGRANGAFTYFDLRSYNCESTYREEYDNIRKYLPNLKEGFDQAPELSGDVSKFGNEVFI